MKKFLKDPITWFTIAMEVIQLTLCYKLIKEEGFTSDTVHTFMLGAIGLFMGALIFWILYTEKN